MASSDSETAPMDSVLEAGEKTRSRVTLRTAKREAAASPSTDPKKQKKAQKTSRGADDAGSSAHAPELQEAVADLVATEIVAAADIVADRIGQRVTQAVDTIEEKVSKAVDGRSSEFESLELTVKALEEEKRARDLSVRQATGKICQALAPLFPQGNVSPEVRDALRVLGAL